MAIACKQCGAEWHDQRAELGEENLWSGGKSLHEEAWKVTCDGRTPRFADQRDTAAQHDHFRMKKVNGVRQAQRVAARGVIEDLRRGGIVFHECSSEHTGAGTGADGKQSGKPSIRIARCFSQHALVETPTGRHLLHYATRGIQS